MQQRLKPAAGPTNARIVAAELFHQFLIPVKEAIAPLYVRFGWEAAPAFTAPLESWERSRNRL